MLKMKVIDIYFGRFCKFFHDKATDIFDRSNMYDRTVLKNSYAEIWEYIYIAQYRAVDYRIFFRQKFYIWE